jgi:hypothetical protein
MTRDLAALSSTRASGLFIICILLTLNGCTSTYQITDHKDNSKSMQFTREEFLESTVGESWTATLVNGQQFSAVLRPAGRDSICLVRSTDSLTLPLKQVKSFSRKYYVFGLIVYPLSATLGGALGGGAIASSSGGFWAGYVGFMIGMSIGAVTGLTLGILAPPQVVYEVHLID